jgi:hypothetical protein
MPILPGRITPEGIWLPGRDLAYDAGTEVPQEVPGLRLWLAARKETAFADTAAVATPTNWAGYGNNLTQATGGKQPTYQTAVIDGQPVFRFVTASAQEWIATAGNILTVTNAVSGITVFVVAAVTSGATGVTQELINIDTATLGSARFKYGSRFVSGFPDRWHGVGRRLDADTQVVSTSEVSVDTAWHLHTVVPTWSAGTIDFYREQTADATGVAWTTSGTTSATDSSRVDVGSKGGSEYLGGDIAEVLVYDRVLSAGDLQQVWDYLLGIYPSLAGETPIALVDTGSAADAITIAAAVPLVDTGSGADTVAISAAVPLTDSSSASETLSVSQPITLADTASATDQITVAATVPLADPGTASDSLTIAATVPLVDAGTAADAVAVDSSEQKPVTDTAAGSDTVAVAATVPLAEAGAGSDTLAVAQTRAVAEAGTASDLLAVAQTKALAEVGIASDACTVAAAVPLADLATAAENVAAAALVALAEAAAASDALVVTVPPPVPPPRWTEGATSATGLTEGSAAGTGQVEGALVGAGQVEGAAAGSGQLEGTLASAGVVEASLSV